MYKSNHLKTTSFFALSTLTIALFSSYSYAEEQLEEIKVTAEAQVKQSLGSSLITAKISKNAQQRMMYLKYYVPCQV